MMSGITNVVEAEVASQELISGESGLFNIVPEFHERVRGYAGQNLSNYYFIYR